MPDTTPTFIIGSQRSGTTMFRLMVNNHPEITVPHESVFITVFYRRLAEYGDLGEQTNVAKLLSDISEHHLVVRGGLIPSKEAVLAQNPRSYPELVRAIFDCYATAQGKRIWCDKTPYYTEDVDILNTLFPDCSFIHVVRDGRDVALSQMKTSWLPSSLPTIAQQWQLKTYLARKVGNVLGAGRFLELRYEDLVLHTERELRRVCDFLHVNFEPAMLDYHETAQQVVPSHSLQWHRNSVQKPQSDKVYEWQRRMSRSDRIIFEQYAGGALELFGYELENLPPNLASRAKKVYFATVQRN